MDIWKSPLWSVFDGETGWVSWETIRGCLSGTMEQVRLHLKAFSDAGFSLQEDPAHGCRILHRPDRLFPPWILSGLKTRRFGRNIYYAHTVDSTQEIALERARLGDPEGTVALCEYQRQGRGRRGRTWESPPCTNILMSVLIRRPGALDESFTWTQIASLAVAEAVERTTGEKAWIKWPNDVYVRARKLAGILADWAPTAGAKPALVVGMGVNVGAAPPGAPAAVCLRDVTPTPPLRAVLVRRILEGLEYWCEAIRSRGCYLAWKPWLGRSWILGKKVRIENGEQVTQGEVEGFLPDGRLRLCCETGQRVTFSAGDVRVLPLEGWEAPL